MTNKINPFLWVDALCKKDSGPMAEHGEAAYPAYMVNRAMSQYQDCLFHANEMNLFRDLDSRLQYDFYMYGIRAKKRWAKWHKKPAADESISAVMDHYGVNREVAEGYLGLMTSEQIDEVVSLAVPESK